MKSIDSLRIALVGYGEVGCIFGSRSLRRVSRA